MKVKNSQRPFVGAYVDPELKLELKEIAKRERRSVNAQIEIFLASGVAHLKSARQKLAA